MKIGIIGSGNVGGALTKAWSSAGHEIILGVRDTSNFKGIELLKLPRVGATSIENVSKEAEVILLAAGPDALKDILEALGDLSGVFVIDAMNSVRSKPEPYRNTSEAILALRPNVRLVKCFNTTGYENMLNPVYPEGRLDLVMSGDDLEAKAIASKLALDAGFGSCLDFGSSKQFQLQEYFALSWINLAIMQGHGRQMGIHFLYR
jgi:predicted dinucleotide-binding enzyme